MDAFAGWRRACDGHPRWQSEMIATSRVIANFPRADAPPRSLPMRGAFPPAALDEPCRDRAFGKSDAKGPLQHVDAGLEEQRS